VENMNVPNFFTLIRFVLIPIFVTVFFKQNNREVNFYCITIFLIAGLTDILDGYIARKYNMITKLGTLMDPLADKLTILTILFCLCIKKYIPIWIFAIALLKEICMVSGATRLYKKDIIIPANYYGKLATCVFYIAIILSFLKIKHNIVFFIIAIIMAILALVKYFNNYKSVIKE
jgi:cardiolipin synthase